MFLSSIRTWFHIRNWINLGSVVPTPTPSLRAASTYRSATGPGFSGSGLWSRCLGLDGRVVSDFRDEDFLSQTSGRVVGILHFSVVWTRTTKTPETRRR